MSPRWLPGTAFCDPQHQRLPGGLQQTFGGRRDPADRQGQGGVSIESPVEYPVIDADDIAFPQDLFRGDPVHHLVVDRGAESGGESVVALEGGLGLVLERQILRDFVQFQGGDAGVAVALEGVEDVGHDLVAFPQDRDFVGRLQVNHGPLLRNKV